MSASCTVPGAAVTGLEEPAPVLLAVAGPAPQARLSVLTGSYPPFTLEDADYPVLVAVRPGRLNRLAVLFRIVLLVAAEGAIDNYAASAKACADQLACLTSLDRQVAGVLGRFAGQLPNIRMPRGRAGAAAAALTASAAHASGVFGSLAAAATASQYQAMADSDSLPKSVTRMNQDYLALRYALGDR